MEFRPCIDIHNGKVKQIVGGSLKDAGNQAVENFVAQQDAAFFAKLYQRYQIKGGHVILLNPVGSEFYEATKEQALLALRAYPGGMQVGGGMNPDNAWEFLDAGASHVIATSYVFREGVIRYEHLQYLADTVGREHLVLDLSCRRQGSDYFIVTDRWQKSTRERITVPLLNRLSEYADEFLIHAVDVEGKARGIEKDLVALLGSWGKIPITYAGGVGSFEDLEMLRELGKNRLNVTIGSALDLFGGNLEFEKVLRFLA